VADEHKKFTLRGGPHSKMIVRVYPDFVRDKGVKREVSSDLELGGERYEQPEKP